MTLFEFVSPEAGEESVQEVMRSDAVRIERIVSRGHSSPPDFWCDQPENEWVTVLSGAARLEFESGDPLDLLPGHHVDIPAHVRHRVAWTDPDQDTVWLAVFYS
ncbi:MAG: cupin domain-containing protein [Gemmatimonadota bacterium]|nr:MAG: cupin domain-containing protein [Gemmatimonadota bacterium]